jgi:hypothetical protein
MARALADIEEDIIALSDKERAELLGRLIAGLDSRSEISFHTLIGSGNRRRY